MNKVSTEELEELKTLKESLVSIVTAIGEFSLSKHLLETELNEIDEKIKTEHLKFKEFQAKERVLFEKLQQTYGPGNIDLTTGEITV